ASGKQGIGHTRWATHGGVTERNAHPHVGGDGVVAVVHNGVIENYTALRRQLQQQGYAFHSETDTEVIAHPIARHFEGDLLEAVRRALPHLKGTYGLAVVSPLCPGLVVGARLGSPLVLGVGEGEYFLASDPNALAGRVSRVVYLEDHQICTLTPQEWKIYDRENSLVAVQVHTLDTDGGDAELG